MKTFLDKIFDTIQTANQEIYSRNVSKIMYIYAFIYFSLLTILLYGRTIGFGFFGEDLAYTLPLSQYKFFAALDIPGKYWRPLQLLWLMLQYELFGMNASLYHGVQLTLHFLNLILAFTLFVRMGIPVLVGIFSVSVWSILAGNAVPITWFSQCSDTFSMMFLLIAFHLWLYFLKSDFSNLWAAILSGIAWLFSMSSKEVGFLFPVICILSSLFWEKFYASKVGKIPKRAFIVPLAFLLLHIIALTVFHGDFFWFVLKPEDGVQTLIANLPLHLHLLSRIVHYLEGLFYLLCPLDLANSSKAISICLFLTIVMLVQLWILIKGRWTTQGVFVLGVVVAAMFSIHTVINPHPRTLYIATLWISLAICSVYLKAITRNFIEFDTKEKQSVWNAVSRSLPCLIFSSFIVMHIFLGQLVVQSYSPRSDSIIIDYINWGFRESSHPFHRLSPEKIEYIQKELRFINTEKFDANVSSEKLDKLPTEVKIPDYLEKKINYDAEKKVLIFKGVMTKREYKDLLRLSEDIPYKEAIERLQTQSVQTYGTMGPWRRFLREKYQQYIKK